MVFSFRDYLLGFQSLQNNQVRFLFSDFELPLFCRVEPDHQDERMNLGRELRRGRELSSSYRVSSRDGRLQSGSRDEAETDASSSYRVRELVDWELKLAVMRTGLALL